MIRPPRTSATRTAHPGSIRSPSVVTFRTTPPSRALPAGASRALTVGVRASALRVQPRPGDLSLPGRVELADISGSDTFVHVETSVGELVAQLTGVHEFQLGAPIQLHLSAAQAYVFDGAGALLVAPPRRAAA